MIKGFEPIHPLEPETQTRLQWGPAVGAGLIAGIILLLIPRGSPWSSMTFFSPIVMGRNVSGTGLPVAAAWFLHIILSILYGLLISRCIAGLRQGRAVLTGGFFGLILYVINFGIVSTFWRELRGDEIPVVFTHVVFGLIAAGAYRGLLKRKRTDVSTA